MSRSSSSNAAPTMGLTPLDSASPQKDEKGGGGVFRLDTMTPGAETPENLSAPTKSRLSMQTLFLLVLVCGGAGLIYAMRMVGIGPLTAMAFAQMPDYDLSKPGSKTAEHKKVLDQLSAANVKTQVPVDQVQKNPFRMSDVLAPDTKTDDSASKASSERARRDAEAKRRKVETALAGLQLHGVIGGSNPVARISGQAVRIGDTVAEVFTVKAIHGRSVDLEYEGQVTTLSLDDDEANTNPNGKPKQKK